MGEVEYTNNNSLGGNERIDLEPISVQYVAIVGHARATNYGYSLYEFEVYGRNLPGRTSSTRLSDPRPFLQSQIPSSAPSTSPSTVPCQDNKYFTVKVKSGKAKLKTCKWLQKQPELRAKYCEKKRMYGEKEGVIYGPPGKECRETCRSCTDL